jgi:predicted RNase H-like HicB family nuclease
MFFMQSIRYVYWQDGDAWLGHLEEYPDYLTQGDSLSDLEEHLRDLHKDLSSGAIP